MGSVDILNCPDYKNNNTDAEGFIDIDTEKCYRYVEVNKLNTPFVYKIPKMDTNTTVFYNYDEMRDEFFDDFKEHFQKKFTVINGMDYFSLKFEGKHEPDYEFGSYKYKIKFTKLNTEKKYIHRGFYSKNSFRFSFTNEGKKYLRINKGLSDKIINKTEESYNNTINTFLKKGNLDTAYVINFESAYILTVRESDTVYDNYEKYIPIGKKVERVMRVIKKLKKDNKPGKTQSSIKG